MSEQARPRLSLRLSIKYINHSGFIIEDRDTVIMIDCCGLTRNSPEVVSCRGKTLYILASHVHGDHFDSAIMTFGTGKCQWILSGDIREKTIPGKNMHFLYKGNAYTDDLVTIKAYGSTDEGVSFYIETGGKKIFHAGDLNNWHWNEEETPEDAAKNEKFFLDELEYIAGEISDLDVVMFPVDPRLGKDYTRGAEQFLDRIKTKLFIPMHFWDKMEAAAAFRPEAEKRGCRFAEIRAPGDVFEI